MAISDPIADMLTKIRNAYLARHDSLEVSCSKINSEIIRVMKAEGFVGDYSITESEQSPFKKIKITLKYDSLEKPVIHEIKKISTPGRRVYSKYKNIHRIRNGFGTTIVSTSHGMLTDKQAREQKIGGELICSIW